MREYLTDKTLNPQVKSDRTPNPLIEEFKESEEYRYAYADEHLNTTIALQIRALREQRGMKQSDLAKEVGTQQPGIARLENVNYSRWNTETLKKIARALGVRLKITFETFGSLLEEDASFSRESLQRPKFEDDPAFKEEPEPIDAELLRLLVNARFTRDMVMTKTAAVLNQQAEELAANTNVVSFEDYLGRRAHRAAPQEGLDIYENLVNPTGQSRRTAAS